MEPDAARNAVDLVNQTSSLVQLTDRHELRGQLEDALAERVLASDHWAQLPAIMDLELGTVEAPILEPEAAAPVTRRVAGERDASPQAGRVNDDGAECGSNAAAVAGGSGQGQLVAPGGTVRSQVQRDRSRR